jgi:septal ring factor EnvC (AmiA/AmiB activator)
MLRRIRASQERTEQDIADLKTRMSTVEEHIGQLTIAIGHVHTQIAGLNKRMYRFDERLARIERRLDLAEV